MNTQKTKEAIKAVVIRQLFLAKTEHLPTGIILDHETAALNAYMSDSGFAGQVDRMVGCIVDVIE